MTGIEALFLLFLGLKLAGVIDWSWLVVFSPLIVTVVAQVLTTLAKK